MPASSPAIVGVLTGLVAPFRLYCYGAEYTLCPLTIPGCAYSDYGPRYAPRGYAWPSRC